MHIIDGINLLENYIYIHVMMEYIDGNFFGVICNYFLKLKWTI